MVEWVRAASGGSDMQAVIVWIVGRGCQRPMKSQSFHLNRSILNLNINASLAVDTLAVISNCKADLSSV